MRFGKLLLVVVVLLGMTLTAMSSVSAQTLPGDELRDFNVKIRVDGNEIFSDSPPYIKKGAGTTFVPVRFVVEALGAEVEWDDKTQTASVYTGETEIKVTIGSKKASINGKAIELNIAPELRMQRTMVPLRVISEGLGAKVDWDGTTNTVDITMPKDQGPAQVEENNFNEVLEITEKLAEKHGFTTRVGTSKETIHVIMDDRVIIRTRPQKLKDYPFTIVSTSDMYDEGVLDFMIDYIEANGFNASKHNLKDEFIRVDQLDDPHQRRWKAHKLEEGNIELYFNYGNYKGILQVSLYHK